MTRKQILLRIRQMCLKCPLRCDADNCPIYALKGGVDSTCPKRKMSINSLMNLTGWRKKMKTEKEDIRQ